MATGGARQETVFPLLQRCGLSLLLVCICCLFPLLYHLEAWAECMYSYPSCTFSSGGVIFTLSRFCGHLLLCLLLFLPLFVRGLAPWRVFLSNSSFAIPPSHTNFFIRAGGLREEGKGSGKRGQISQKRGSKDRLVVFFAALLAEMHTRGASFYHCFRLVLSRSCMT